MVEINDPLLLYIFYGVLNLLFILLISPFYMGLVKKIKAYAQRRKGPPLLQNYYNLKKLMKKEVIYSVHSSLIMRTTPYINFVVILIAGLFVPLVFLPLTETITQPLGDIGNILVFLYLLAVAKFFLAMSGFDAGSTFGGMAGSREMSIATIIEPITVVVFVSLAFVFQKTNIINMFNTAVYCTNNLNNLSNLSLASYNTCTSYPILIPISMALFIVLLVEIARIPVDNPETHLELTMIHEGMVLEQSGRNLALLEYSHAIKQTLFMALLINIFLPFGLTTELDIIPLLIAIVSFFVKGVLLAVFIGIIESSIAKQRLFRLPGTFMIAFFLSLVTLALALFK